VPLLSLSVPLLSLSVPLLSLSAGAVLTDTRIGA